MKKPMYLLPALLFAGSIWAQVPTPEASQVAVEPLAQAEAPTPQVEAPSAQPEVSTPQVEQPKAPQKPAAEQVQAPTTEQMSPTNEKVQQPATPAVETTQAPVESETLTPEAATPVQPVPAAPATVAEQEATASAETSETSETQDQSPTDTTPKTNSEASPKATTQNASADKSDNKKPSDKKEDSQGGSERNASAGISGGSISVGLTELDGESVTRISYRPEVTFGKLGVALDLELFIDSDGNFLPFGWEFDTKDQILNTIYRKIYYIRWDQPGAPFYARAGALEGITLDAAGLVTNNWGNVANYPKQKLIGIHTQINESITPFKISVDVATNSVQDWHHGGGVLALKGGFAPLASTPLPLLNGLRLSATSVTDFNQKAAILDRDEDGCPDDLDYDPKRGGICSDPNVSLADMRDLNSEELVNLRDQEIAKLDALDEEIKNDFKRKEEFTIMALDAFMPIYNSDFFSINSFMEAAKPITQDKEAVARQKSKSGLDGLNEAWALVPFGFNGNLSIIDWGFQYRILNGGFSPGHFDAAYELQRMNFINGSYISKKDMYWETNLGYREGYYGTLGANLFDVVRADASYSHLISNKKEKGQTIPDDKAFSAQAGLGSMILGYIPKVSTARVFMAKTKIGQDSWEETAVNKDGIPVLEQHTDGFFQVSEYTTWGFTIGAELGGGLELNITRSTTFEREYEDGRRTNKLLPNDNFFAETVLKF